MQRAGLIALALVASCADAPPSTTTAAQDSVALVELVESFPVETDMDREDLRQTQAVWLEMIDGARETIELEHFYASNQPGSQLEDVIVALERAAARGVQVSFTADLGFYERTYAETLDRLQAREGIDVQFVDYSSQTGGIQHAKCMLVDGRDLYAGSANFDWRALEHIQELGLRVQSEVAGEWIGEVLAYDRALATGDAAAVRALQDRASERGERPSVTARFADGTTFELSPAFSPRGELPNDSTWDLPLLLEWITAAHDSIQLQVLSYKPKDRQGEWWSALDDALRAAAERGVTVRLIVADWSKKRGSIEALASLAALPKFEVSFLVVPPHSSGEIPFGRVAHAKYLVVDEQRAWLGSSNWQRGYFTKSRNIGFFCEGVEPARRLTRFFERNWTSQYAERVEPAETADRPGGH